MELKNQLEIVDVQFEDNKKATVVFLDEEMGEIREVNFNKQKYDKDSNKYVDDVEKAKQVEEWCQEHFNVTFDRLAECIGEKKDVYCYDGFNSVFPVKQIVKYDEDMVGQIFEVEVVHAEDDGLKISIQFEHDGHLRESKMQYADYLDARKEWFTNPLKKKKQYEKFNEKFQMPVEEIHNLIGKTVMCEVKKAMGKYVYVEIKPFPKKKKKSS